MKMACVRTGLTVGALLAVVACANSSGSNPSEGTTRAGARSSGHDALSKESTAHAASRRPTWRSPDGARESLRGRRERAHRHGGAGKSAAKSEAPAVINGGGLVVAAPKLVPIIFPGNPYDAQIRDFYTKLAGSHWWAAATSEYGVGPIDTLPVYVPPGTPPTSDTIDQWIVDLASSPPAGLPAPDDDTIYSIVLPLGWGQDEGACVSFGAYHEGGYTASGQLVSYTVNPTCAVPYLGMIGIGQVTDAVSHEVEEAATDPEGSGFVGQNWAASGWGTAAEGVPGAETADMCEFQPDADYIDPQIGYLVQRIWSNAQAAAGHDPCAPLLPGEGPYFTATPLPPDGTQDALFVNTRGVSIPPGGEATIPVAFTSDAPMGEWQVAAAESVNPHLMPDTYGELSFSWDRASGKAGDVRHLTIKRSPTPDGGAPAFLRVAINSTAGAVTHTSWLIVGTD